MLKPLDLQAILKKAHGQGVTHLDLVIGTPKGGHFGEHQCFSLVSPDDKWRMDAEVHKDTVYHLGDVPAMTDLTGAGEQTLPPAPESAATEPSDLPADVDPTQHLEGTDEPETPIEG